MKMKNNTCTKMNTTKNPINKMKTKMKGEHN